MLALLIIGINMSIAGITGHRNIDHATNTVKAVLREKYYQYNVEAVISGMALGFDMLAAEVAIEEEIPLVAAIPFNGHTELWPSKEKGRFVSLIEQAWKVHVVSKGKYAIWKLHARNRFIINRSDFLLAYWSGSKSGGTRAALNLAEQQGKPFENLYHLCSTLHSSGNPHEEK